jgi:hypothetical protein
VQDAAELAGDALRLTAAGQGEYDGRLLALARYLISVGEHPRATRLLAGADRHTGCWPGASHRALSRPPSPRIRILPDEAGADLDTARRDSLSSFNIPLGRPGTADDVAALVTLLVSPPPATHRHKPRH